MQNSFFGCLLIHRALRNIRNIHKLCTIAEAHTKNVDSSVKTTIKGWVRGLRAQKANVFVDVSDGSCGEKLQVVLPAELRPARLSWGASVEVTGRLGVSPRGQLELQADSMRVLREVGLGEGGYPFLPRQQHSPEYVRQYLHFRPRTLQGGAMLRVRDAAERALHAHLGALGYISVHTPVLTANDCEGAGEVFRVLPENPHTLKLMHREGVPDEETYFGSKTFLTVSGQLHLEAAAHGLSKVYTLGPTFRAENSKSRLHLSEFYMLEAELAFTDDLEDMKRLIEGIMKSVGKAVFERCPSDMRTLRGGAGGEPPGWLEQPFHSVTYEEALAMLAPHCDAPLERGGGLSKEHELQLVQLLGGPTFVTHWPADCKPFYMKRDPKDHNKVLALDLLCDVVGEVAGGSVREECPSALQARLPSPALSWYLALRQHGGVPTAGFGLGFERLLQTLTHTHSIKDCIPFPRWPHNCQM